MEDRIFTEAEIREIHRVTKVTPQYLHKYDKLPASPVHPRGVWPVNFDFPRTHIILDFCEWVDKHNLTKPKHLGFTYDDVELSKIHPTKRTKLLYPPHDLHTLSQSYKGDPFDFFVFNQTLEHLFNPRRAIKEIVSLVEVGGYIFTSVPTINIPHCTPIHFSGIYPVQLALLFIEAGCEVVEMGQYGSLNYITKLFQMFGWPSHKDLKNPQGITVNEEKYVAQCWILAKKK